MPRRPTNFNMGYGQGTLGILARYLHARRESAVVQQIDRECKAVRAVRFSTEA
jgi:hypothetical protein